ncbi:class I SAM-dependent methyltransferase [soil metagenome]
MNPRPAANQDWRAQSYAANARFVSDLAGDVLAWLAPQPGQRILDLGCGDGVITAHLASLGVDVLGVDQSEDMLKAARDLGCAVRRISGEALDFDGEFDAVFSNAALHWMTRVDDVIAGVGRALKPGGRFVAEFGGHGNVAAIATAMRATAAKYNGDPALAHPWVFPSPEWYRARLESAGFTTRRIGLYPRPTPLKTGMEAWLRVFRSAFFDQFGDSAGAALADTVALLRPSLCDESGDWTADYVRLRVEAVKP